MTKFLPVLATAFSAGAMLLGSAGVTLAHAQTTPTHRVLKARGHVHANGRCHGMSYGTGASSCGTATGGPVGGLSSRN